jgi:hypothetical protein
LRGFTPLVLLEPSTCYYRPYGQFKYSIYVSAQEFFNTIRHTAGLTFAFRRCCHGMTNYSILLLCTHTILLRCTGAMNTPSSTPVLFLNRVISLEFRWNFRAALYSTVHSVFHFSVIYGFFCVT